RLDVAVDDALGVGVDQCQQHLGDQLQAGLERQRPLRRQPLAQRLSLQILHYQEWAVGTVEARVVDGDDVRVGELADQLRLALEALVEAGLVAQLGVHQLDGDGAFEGLIDGAIDLGHPSAATHFLQAVTSPDDGRQSDVGRLAANAWRLDVLDRRRLRERSPIVRAEAHARLEQLLAGRTLNHAASSASPRWRFGLVSRPALPHTSPKRQRGKCQPSLTLALRARISSGVAAYEPEAQARDGKEPSLTLRARIGLVSV